jgi:hypothetical protein
MAAKINLAEQGNSRKSQSITLTKGAFEHIARASAFKSSLTERIVKSPSKIGPSMNDLNKRMKKDDIAKVLNT